MILCLAGAVAVGFFGIAYFNNNPALAGAVNKTQNAYLLNWRRSCLTRGLPVFCCLLSAAVMSTLSCQLLVCSSAITEDLYKAFLRKAPASKSWYG